MQQKPRFLQVQKAAVVRRMIATPPSSNACAYF